MRNNHFDVAVIGAGSAGLTAAVGLAKVGQRVLLIEKDTIGGECTNSGCIPSKALLHYAKTYHRGSKISDRSVADETVDTKALAYARGKIAEVLATETPAHFEQLGITVISGEAIFTNSTTLTVDDTVYTFKKAVVATGSSPKPLAVPGLQAADILTNQNFFTQTTLPKQLLIIGSGPIGLELGQACAMLGCKVTIATIACELGEQEDVAIRHFITSACEELGIKIEYQAQLTTVENGLALFNCQTSAKTAKTFSLPFDKILIAVGRTPHLPAGLALAGIEYTTAGINTDTQHRTSNRSIYAIGDVASPLQFTHVADDAGRDVIAHIASRGLLRHKEKAVPKITYTEPEIGQVGMGWEQAVGGDGADRLMRIEVPLSSLDRALTDNATDGILVVIARRLSGKILGAHYIGPRAGEIISIFTLAIDTRLSLWKLRRSIYAYPTYSALIKKAGDHFFAEQIKTLKPDLTRVIKRHLIKITIISLWLVALFILYTVLATTGLTPTILALTLFQFMSQTIWGPILYILAYTIRPLTFLPGSAMTILSGVFFGLWGGIVYTIIGSNLSAVLAYIIGRFFSAEKIKNSEVSRVSFLVTRPFESILIARLAFLPYDVINYGAGILRVPFIPYFFATIIGTALGIATFVAIGASISVTQLIDSGISTDVIDAQFILLSVAIAFFSLAISTLLRFFKKTTLPSVSK